MSGRRGSGGRGNGPLVIPKVKNDDDTGRENLPVIRAEVMADEPEGIFLMLAPATPPRTPKIEVDQGLLSEDENEDMEDIPKVQAVGLAIPQEKEDQSTAREAKEIPLDPPPKEEEPEPSEDESEDPLPYTGDPTNAAGYQGGFTNTDQERMQRILQNNRLDEAAVLTSDQVDSFQRSDSPTTGEPLPASGDFFTVRGIGIKGATGCGDAKFTGSYLRDDEDDGREEVELDQWGRPVVQTRGGMSKKVGDKWEVDMSFVQARSRNVENFRKQQSREHDAKYAKPGELVLGADELKGGQNPEVDPTRKEQYLSDEDFQTIFGMSREEFSAIPKWKQNNKKKDVGLY